MKVYLVIFILIFWGLLYVGVSYYNDTVPATDCLLNEEDECETFQDLANRQLEAGDSTSTSSIKSAFLSLVPAFNINSVSPAMDFLFTLICIFIPSIALIYIIASLILLSG